MHRAQIVDLGRKCVHRCLVGDVGHNGGAADLGCERGDPIRATGRADDVKAKGGKGFRGSGADSGTGAGHYRDADGTNICRHVTDLSGRAKFLS
ncbi:hypothetical protein MAUB_24140 [Mycolicibacterium aubagnense]|uniref:Uncharacterized protein n=1 Tax=Mycolicibacterium aubagnense TaxID=319707 RepID=A0ABN5YS20_9MYCO|nr:hypothetical protein MAUB_24140 [Mycolicibacterium aubagnense]